MKRLRIWTDGSYRSSLDSGGMAIVVVDESNQVIYKYAEQSYNTTNNRMEIKAIITALSYVDEPIESLTVYTDSKYCLGIINNNWRRHKNGDFWKAFDEALKTIRANYCKNIRFMFTKGHSSDEFNILADQLATTASDLKNTSTEENTISLLTLVNELQRTKQEYVKECKTRLMDAELDSEKKRLRKHINLSYWWIAECDKWKRQNQK